MKWLGLKIGLLFLIILPVGFSATSVFAQSVSSTCECYCAIDGVGATRFPDLSTKLTSQDCQKTCRDSGYTVAACASTPDQKPQNNVQCFTPTQCSNQGGILTATGTGTPPQPGECQAGMYYCYPDPGSQIKTNLQVSIGGLNVTGDFGEYIATAYKWLLGAGTTIAIVLLMVSGLRWSLGGISSSQVSKAKETIKRVIIGLVLLISSYLILYTVNPYLLRLKVPSFPLIRTVTTVGENSCGYLTGVWGISPYLISSGAPYDSPYARGQDPGKPYTVANATHGTECGSIADVIKDPDGNDVTSGQTCTYDYCPPGKTCYASSGGGQCLTCGEITNENEFITPSSSVCSSLSLRTTFKGAFKQINQCFWTKDATFQPGLDDPLLGDGTCVMLSIDCSNIRSCEDYDTKAMVSNNDASDDLESIQFAGVHPGYSDTWGDESLKTICDADPCGVAQAGERCFSEGVTSLISGNDCETIDL